MLPIEICVEDRKKNGHRNTYQRSLKGDVTRNGFSATQCCNVGQFCNHWKHCRNNVLTLCCAKNCHCESSGVTSPLKYYIKSNIRLKRSKINYNASVLDNTAKRKTADAKCIALPVILLGHLFCVRPPHRP